MNRVELQYKLYFYRLPEIQKAMYILSLSRNRDVALHEMQKVWEQIFIAIEKHQTCKNKLANLVSLERELINLYIEKRCKKLCIKCAESNDGLVSYLRIY